MKYVDRFDKEIKIGSKVIYTTNSRESGLNYALVLDIYQSKGKYNNYISHKVKLRPLEDDGREMHEKDIVWNVPGDYKQGYQTVELEKLARASTVDYGKNKFLVLE